MASNDDSSKDTWKKVGLEIIKKGLPILGGAIGNAPGAALAQVIASAIPGGADPNDPNAILEAVKNDPAAVVELQKVQTEHLERLEALKFQHERMELEREQAYLADTQSARQREAAVTQATGKQDSHLYVLAWIVVGGFILLTLITLFVDIPKDNAEAVFLVLGAFVSGFSTVLAYFFGSTKGSAEKSQMMLQMQALTTQVHQQQQPMQKFAARGIAA